MRIFVDGRLIDGLIVRDGDSPGVSLGRRVVGRDRVVHASMLMATAPDRFTFTFSRRATRALRFFCSAWSAAIGRPFRRRPLARRIRLRRGRQGISSMDIAIAGAARLCGSKTRYGTLQKLLRMSTEPDQLRSSERALFGSNLRKIAPTNSSLRIRKYRRT